MSRIFSHHLSSVHRMAYHNYLQQGAVTLNNSISIAEFKKRLQIAKHNSGNEGATIYPGGTDQNTAVIHQGDLLFAMRPTSRASRQGSTGGNLNVFSSFNGIMINPHDDAPLDQKIMILGVAKGTMNPFSPAQPNEGVASYFRGTSDVRYNCPNGAVCHPGDLLMYKVPSINGKDYTPPFNDRPVTKIDLQVQPFTWDGLKFETERISQVIFDETNTGQNAPLINALDCKTRLTKDLNNLSRIKKAALLTSACRTVEVLVRRGLVKIVTPEEKEKELLVQRLLSDEGFDAATFRSEYNKIKPTSVVGDKGTHLVFDETVTEEMFEKTYAEIKCDNPEKCKTHLDSILWFCQVLGVSPSDASYPTQSSSQNVGEQVEVQKDIVYANLWPHIHGVERIDGLEGDLARTEIYRPLKEFSSMLNISNRSAKDAMVHYSKFAQELPYLVEQFSAEVRRTELSKVIGTALSYGDPNTTNPKVSCLLGRPFTL